MDKIFVTGAASLIGSNHVDQLLRGGKIVMDNFEWARKNESQLKFLT